MGLIIRSCCAEASPEDIADDVEEMAQLADNVINDDSDEMAMLVAGDGPTRIGVARLDGSSRSCDPSRWF